MVTYSEIRKNAYFDSVTLMLVSSEAEKTPGVQGAAVMMGTDHNKALMIKAGLLTEAQAPEFGANDLYIGIAAESEDAVEAARSAITAQFDKKAGSADEDLSRTAKTVSSAAKKLPGANMCIVSLPGRYAKRAAMEAMKNDLHVLLFSDNVSIDEENDLKDYALAHGLLMMGPDCGTAIIGGTALGFANVVRRGSVGLVAAAGTGLQEVTVILDAMGSGISEAIGTGGRDVREEIGGKMMLFALDALENDPETKVIGIISKPPAASVLEKIREKVRTFSKPVVACLLGAPKGWEAGSGIIAAATLKEAAQKLAEIDQDTVTFAGEPVLAAQPAVSGSRKYVRGLYTGGTLCAESEIILTEKLGKIYSNIAHDPDLLLADPETSKCHTLVDMGDDHFTDGMAHPMIDPRGRSDRLRRELEDPETAVVLLDCVLGYGCHPDPAGEIANAVESVRTAGRELPLIVASVCGTDKDTQVRSQQEEKLRNAGIVVAKCNADAAEIAAAAAGIR